MDLNEYQRLASETDQQPDAGAAGDDMRSMLVPLLGLSSEVGELLGEYKKRLRDGESYKHFTNRAKEELGDLLWYLFNVATKFDLTLDDVAKYNLQKIANRWKITTSLERGRQLFDAPFPAAERLPRKMDVLIYEEHPKRAQMRINGKAVGNRIRDNRYTEDAYRFHDVFHLAYASVLGWSPTLRAILKCKRKSNPLVDEVEDGGRACATEEGIAAMVFSYAEGRNFLEGSEGVDYDLLRTIKAMSKHLEVKACTEGEWERAIIVGFQVWRDVRALGGGHLEADLNKGILQVIN